MQRDPIECYTSPESEADAALHAYLASTAYDTWNKINEAQICSMNSVIQVLLPL